MTQRKTKEQFIEESKKVHEGKYDYSKVEYKGNNILVNIICPLHGDFFQYPKHHRVGRGCRSCGGTRANKDRKLTQDQFITKAISKHGSRYSYKKASYVSTDIPVTIECSIHGDFKQTPDKHLSGQNCPICSHHASKPEEDIYNFLTSHGCVVEKRKRDLIPPKEVDLFLPEQKIAIEYCGLLYHSTYYKKEVGYHKNKWKACKKLGIKLITIFEDEWIYKRPIVENMLLAKTGKLKSPSIYARTLKIEHIDIKKYKPFYDENHIQGFVVNTLTYGLVSPSTSELVAALSFTKRKDGIWEIVRYATSTRVPGGFSKLLEYFKKNNEWKEIYSFADLRWSDGGLYDRTGFQLDDVLSPDYQCVVGNKRYHKFGFRHTKLKNKLEYYDPSLTEKQNCYNHGIFRIYDCGKIRFRMITV